MARRFRGLGIIKILALNYICWPVMDVCRLPRSCAQNLSKLENGLSCNLSILDEVTFRVVVFHLLLPGVDFFTGGVQRLVLVVWIGQTISTVPIGATAADRD